MTFEHGKGMDIAVKILRSRLGHFPSYVTNKLPGEENNTGQVRLTYQQVDLMISG